MIAQWRQYQINIGIALVDTINVRARAHRKKTGEWDVYTKILGVPTAVISGITSASIISNPSNLVTQVLSLIVTSLTILTAFLKPGETKKGHETAYKAYEVLSNDVVYYCEFECTEENGTREEKVKLLSKSYKKFNDRYSKLQKDSPNLGVRVLDNAHNELGLGEPEDDANESL